MEKFNAFVIPFLKDGFISYTADGVAKSISTDYFRNNFRKIAATELPHIGHRYYFYQHAESLDFVLRFRITSNGGSSVMLLQYSEFEKQWKAIEHN